jgi:hypothetical protein
MTQTRKHSLFAPSATKRILECPGSVELSKHVEDRAGFFAAQGSVAHKLAEEVLAGKTVKLSGHVETFEGREIEIDDEQEAAILTYVNYVDELRRRRTSQQHGGWVRLEETVNLEPIWQMLAKRKPPGDVFGHLDCGAWFPDEGELVIADYKHGSGNAVEVRDNPQMFVYALGLLGGVLLNAMVKKITIVVVQPRCDHPDGPIRFFSIPTVDLFMWAAETYIPTIEAAAKPGAKLSASPENCKFCPAKAECPELRKTALAAARQDFDDVVDSDPLAHRPPPPEPTVLSNGELGAIMDRADLIETWVDAIRNEAAHRLEHGQEVPGWKLVAKRAQRKWADETQAEALLAQAVGERAYKSSLISPAQAEKLVKKPHWNATFAPLVSQVSSGTTLAPASDKRAAVLKGAASQFDELPSPASGEGA